MSDAQSSVEYRDIPGFPGYRAGNDGSILSCRSKKRTGWHPLKQNLAGVYPQVSLQINLVSITKSVHHLILLAFRGPCPPGMQCRHLDGSKDNNRLENLAWGTVQENADDRERHGTLPHGDRHPNRLLSESLVAHIRQMYADGHRTDQLANQFGMSQPDMCSLLNGRRWKRAGGPIVESFDKSRRKRGMEIVGSKLTDDQVREIRARYAAGGETHRSLAKEYGVTYGIIQKIIVRKKWGHVS